MKVEIQDVMNSHGQQMQKELKILRKLSKKTHRNLVSLIDAIYDPEIPVLFIVMEYFELGDLHEFIQKPEVIQQYFSNQEIKINYILKFSLDIINGVVELHKNNIAHRDLKPENIMVAFDFESNSPFLKLIDFGISNENDLMKSQIGTLNYMAPEILYGLKYTNSVDIWSIGCIIHQMITGRLLFGGQQYQEVIVKIKKFEKYKEEHFLSPIVKKCLEVNPNDRINATQLQQELLVMLQKKQGQQQQQLSLQGSQNQQQVQTNSQFLSQQEFMEWSVSTGSENRSVLSHNYQQPPPLQQSYYLDNFTIIDSNFPADESFFYLEVSQIIQEPFLTKEHKQQINTHSSQNDDSFVIIQKQSEIPKVQQSIIENERIYCEILNIETLPNVKVTSRTYRNTNNITQKENFFFQENSERMFEMKKLRFYEGYFRLLVWISLCQIQKNDDRGKLNLQELLNVCVQRYAYNFLGKISKKQNVSREICLIFCALSLCEDAALGVIFYFHKLADIVKDHQKELLAEMEELGKQFFQQRQGILGLVINETPNLPTKNIPFENLMVNLKETKISFNQQQMIFLQEIVLNASQVSQFDRDISCVDGR